MTGVFQTHTCFSQPGTRHTTYYTVTTVSRHRSYAPQVLLKPTCLALKSLTQLHGASQHNSHSQLLHAPMHSSCRSLMLAEHTPACHHQIPISCHLSALLLFHHNTHAPQPLHNLHHSHCTTTSRNQQHHFMCRQRRLGSAHNNQSNLPRTLHQAGKEATQHQQKPH